MDSNVKFSIVIPAYEYNNLAPELLNDLFNSIQEQTYKNYEIIISDHSKTDIVYNFIKGFGIDVIYYKNDRGIGNSSINMNEGIKKASGDFIKIMHMDDWFCNENTLFLINNAINKEPNKKWGGVGFNHFNSETKIIDRYILPHINPNIRTLLGCPSVSFFKNDNNYFDESLIIINDSDMHIRLDKKYGRPIFIDDYCVTIRMSENQVSSQISIEHHNKEIKYYQNKNF